MHKWVTDGSAEWTQQFQIQEEYKFLGSYTDKDDDNIEEEEEQNETVNSNNKRISISQID